VGSHNLAGSLLCHGNGCRFTLLADFLDGIFVSSTKVGVELIRRDCNDTRISLFLLIDTTEGIIEGLSCLADWLCALFVSSLEFLHVLLLDLFGLFFNFLFQGSVFTLVDLVLSLISSS